MKIKTVGKAVVISTTVPFANLVAFAKNAIATDAKGKEVYRMGTGSEGSIKDFGATFTNAAADGTAEFTIKVPNDVTDVAAYVRKNYGEALTSLSLNEVEICTALAEKKVALDSIEIIEG